MEVPGDLEKSGSGGMGEAMTSLDLGSIVMGGPADIWMHESYVTQMIGWWEELEPWGSGQPLQQGKYSPEVMAGCALIH